MQVRSCLHHDPRVSHAVEQTGVARLNQWCGQITLFVQSESQDHIKGTLYPIDADLAITLRRMPISTTKQRAAIEYGQVEPRTRTQLTHVQVPTEDTGRTRAKRAIFIAR